VLKHKAHTCKTILNKIILPEEEVPNQWFNIIPQLPFTIPLPLDDENNSIDFNDLKWLYSTECLKIELQKGKYLTDSYIKIPESVYNEYVKYRPTPLVRAKGLEEYLDTPAEIYYKREDQNPAGSHKINTALAQAYYASQDDIKILVTDTGAGQWGAALAIACQVYNIHSVIFMIKKSFDEKPYRRYLMELIGAEVIASPSKRTKTGKLLLETNPENTGSLGIGMSEAIELVKARIDTRLALGCMSYYAVLHQTVIGLETKAQLNRINHNPDIMVGCVGGGSNFVGFIAPFVTSKVEGSQIRFIAAEPDSVPCLTKGTYRYDWADYNQLTPKIKMFTLGNKFIPPDIHSGGLRYHGKTPILSSLVKNNLIEAESYPQKEVFKAGKLFFETEHILPAPESSHAILATIKEAKKAKQENIKKIIVFCLSGHGYLDLQGYANVFNM
jgi:tryptophan synthase beta chain